MKSRLVVSALLLTCAAVAQSLKAPKPETLRIVADRVAKSLLASSWSAFRKDAAQVVVFQEDYRGYDDFFSVKQFKGMKGMAGEAEYKVISYATPVKNLPNLGKKAALHFSGFCKQVKDSRGYAGPSWEWPTVVDGKGVAELDSSVIMSPCAVGTIASNLDWGVEFISEAGRWKVQRLVLSGH